MEISYIENLVKLVKENELLELDYSIGDESVKIINSKVDNLSDSQAIQRVDTPNSPKVIEEESVEADKKTDDSIFSYIKSNMVGTFYSKSAPDEPEYVKVGDRIKKGDTVCIIESMKMMNELKAPFDCEIEEILCNDGDVVEYSQEIFKVREV